MYLFSILSNTSSECMFMHKLNKKDCDIFFFSAVLL